jgi:hypothetical protein
MGVIPILRALLVMGLLLGVASRGAAAPAAPEPAHEEDVRAVFLLNFLRFIEWPDAIDFRSSSD